MKNLPVKIRTKSGNSFVALYPLDNDLAIHDNVMQYFARLMEEGIVTHLELASRNGEESQFIYLLGSEVESITILKECLEQ